MTKELLELLDQLDAEWAKNMATMRELVNSEAFAKLSPEDRDRLFAMKMYDLFNPKDGAK